MITYPDPICFSPNTVDISLTFFDMYVSLDLVRYLLTLIPLQIIEKIV